ncbi:MAG: hypothetical protein KF690_02750 [Bacteroidetes bacterium]|nr:hypothetical protein [Bacteroidota bacterium]
MKRLDNYKPVADSMGMSYSLWLDRDTRLRASYQHAAGAPGTPASFIHTISCPNALEAQHQYQQLEAFLRGQLGNPVKQGSFGSRSWQNDSLSVHLQLYSEQNALTLSIYY